MKKLIGIGLALLLGCDDDFVKGWEVDRERVLAARVEPTEVTWLVARASHAYYTYAVCTDTHLNAPRCDSPVTATGTGEADGEAIAVPVALPPGSLMLIGFCASAVTLDPVQFLATCADGSPALLASVKTPAQPNANPTTPVLLLDGNAVAAETCVAPGSKHAFGFVFQPQDREEGEELTASTTVTAGTLDRQYTSLEPGEAAPKAVSVAWTAPASGEASVYLVLRDGRGGTSFTTGRVCVR